MSGDDRRGVKAGWVRYAALGPLTAFRNPDKMTPLCSNSFEVGTDGR
jgi:hypothetical protein